MDEKRIEELLWSIKESLTKVETKLDISICRVDKLERNQSWTIKAIIGAFIASVWTLIAK